MARQYRKSKQRRNSLPSKKDVSALLQGFIWGGCFTLTATLSGFIGMTVALKTPLPVEVEIVRERIQNIKRLGFKGLFAKKIDQPVNILLMGIDRVPNQANNPAAKFSGRSDTMLLVRFNPNDSSLKILSIPRDSRVRFPNNRYSKINSANARGGIKYTKQVIENNLAGISVDKYVRVTSDAFKKLIDSLGGVEVYVPKDMKYTDKTQGLYIDLKQGQQTLNGSQAEQFVRYRQDALGDIGRVQRQQILLKALQKKLKSPRTLWQIPKIWKVLQNEIDTDLTQKEIFNLAAFSLGLEKQNIRMLMLPGRASNPREYKLSYWLIASDKKKTIIQDYLESKSVSSNISKSAFRSRIVIQNSTNDLKLGKKVALLLAQNGYRSVYISRRNLPPPAKTQIIVQKGDSSAAKQVLSSLNFGELEYSSTGDINSDITIILGKDAVIINN